MRLIPLILLMCVFSCYAKSNDDIHLNVPSSWQSMRSILQARYKQKQPKMRLTKEQVNAFVDFLIHFTQHTPALLKLQYILPKTTLELLRAIESRGLSVNEAEKIASYLETVPEKYSIRKVAAFDENTSHIIGREWHEIDYHGEGMTWEKQKKKYVRYGITNFKTVDNLTKFFPIESKLPYFRKVYS